MLLRELLPLDHIAVPLSEPRFRDATLELVHRLADAGAIRDVPAVERALLSARGRDVVAIGDQVALPHFRTDAVDQLVLGLGVAPAPLDTAETTLTTPPRIVALVLAPPEAATRYLQTVAALARLFKNEAVVARMGAARTPSDVLQVPELGELRVQPDLRVRDVMAHRADGISALATVREAVDVMMQHGWRALPVLGDRKQVIGIITEWDVMRALLPEIPSAEVNAGQPAVDRPVLVKDAMTRSVMCVAEEMSLEEAAHIMINKNVEQFPVVSEGAITGMLFRGDIIRKLFGG
jgi:CBS domain-containing protein/mannitol/fructose-specific phosphotransferase system IIA component (Ntr-type)